MFVQKAFWSDRDRKHKLAAIADGLFKVLLVTLTIIVVEVNYLVKQVSRDRVVPETSEEKATPL